MGQSLEKKFLCNMQVQNAPTFREKATSLSYLERF